MIDKILYIFEEHKKKYILFKLEERSEEFLYLLHENGKIFSLFYGHNLFPAIKNILNHSHDCVECEIGGLINGGVSLDEGDLVEFKLSIPEANLIIRNLKKFYLKLDKPPLRQWLYFREKEHL